jgi:hypothetical protein
VKRIWKEFWLYLVFSVVTGGFILGIGIEAKAQGRREAIDRYRQECIGADKTAHRNEFTLLYVDEYRASNCEEAIRLIWGP